MSLTTKGFASVNVGGGEDLYRILKLHECLNKCDRCILKSAFSTSNNFKDNKVEKPRNYSVTFRTTKLSTKKYVGSLVTSAMTFSPSFPSAVVYIIAIWAIDESRS